VSQPSHLFVSHACDWYTDNKQTANNGGSICEFDLHSGKFAWVNERYQGIQITDIERNKEANSNLLGKRTEASCREVGAFEKNLHNGRSCIGSW
jgi:hypothetical protein